MSFASLPPVDVDHSPPHAATAEPVRRCAEDACHVDGRYDQLDGILTVFCLIGPNPPNSASEGITLVVPGIINFNKVATGEKVYVRLD